MFWLPAHPQGTPAVAFDEANCIVAFDWFAERPFDEDIDLDLLLAPDPGGCRLHYRDSRPILGIPTNLVEEMLRTVERL